MNCSYSGYRWLALLALTAASPAWAALGKDYDSAILNIEREHYDKAIPLLKEVISEVPASLPRIRLYGMRFAPYTPHYFLGLAHYQLGQCDEALASWANEARFKVLSDENANTMARGRADCEASLLQAGKILPVSDERKLGDGEAEDPALHELVEAYFNGAYEQVASFDPDTLTTGVARAQAWLYRAASQYTLYVLSGQADGKKLSDVHGSLEQARISDPEMKIDRSQFSPKLLILMDKALSR
jgi:tetratricopeptide (TPR) repeat protein